MTRDELKALAAKDTRGIVYDRKYYDRAVKEMGGHRIGEHVGHESNPIQKQHPKLSYVDRTILKNLNTAGPEAVIRTLKSKGWEVKQSGNQYAIRRPGEYDYHVIDEDALSWRDVSDVAGEMVGGLAVGAGTVAGQTLIPIPGVGAVAGGAGTAALWESLLQGLGGKFTDFKATPEEIAGAAGKQALYGAAAVPLSAAAAFVGRPAFKYGKNLVTKGRNRFFRGESDKLPTIDKWKTLKTIRGEKAKSAKSDQALIDRKKLNAKFSAGQHVEERLEKALSAGNTSQAKALTELLVKARGPKTAVPTGRFPGHKGALRSLRRPIPQSDAVAAQAQRLVNAKAAAADRATKLTEAQVAQAQTRKAEMDLFKKEALTLNPEPQELPPISPLRQPITRAEAAAAQAQTHKAKMDLFEKEAKRLEPKPEGLSPGPLPTKKEVIAAQAQRPADSPSDPAAWSRRKNERLVFWDKPSEDPGSIGALRTPKQAPPAETTKLPLNFFTTEGLHGEYVKNISDKKLLRDIAETLGISKFHKATKRQPKTYKSIRQLRADIIRNLPPPARTAKKSQPAKTPKQAPPAEIAKKSPTAKTTKQPQTDRTAEQMKLDKDTRKIIDKGSKDTDGVIVTYLTSANEERIVRGKVGLLVANEKELDLLLENTVKKDRLKSLKKAAKDWGVSTEGKNLKEIENTLRDKLPLPKKSKKSKGQGKYDRGGEGLLPFWNLDTQKWKTIRLSKVTSVKDSAGESLYTKAVGPLRSAEDIKFSSKDIKFSPEDNPLPGGGASRGQKGDLRFGKKTFTTPPGPLRSTKSLVNEVAKPKPSKGVFAWLRRTLQDGAILDYVTGNAFGATGIAVRKANRFVRLTNYMRSFLRLSPKEQKAVLKRGAESGPEEARKVFEKTVDIHSTKGNAAIWNGLIYVLIRDPNLEDFWKSSMKVVKSI